MDTRKSPSTASSRFVGAQPAPILADELPLDGGCVADQRSLCFQRNSCRQCAAAGLCHSRAPLTSAAFFHSTGMFQ